MVTQRSREVKRRCVGHWHRDTSATARRRACELIRSARGSDGCGNGRRLITEEEGSDALREVAEAFHFRDDRVDAHIFGACVMHGEKKYGNFRREFLEFSGSLVAAHSGHGEVKNNQVRFAGLHTNDGLAPVGGFVESIGAGVLGQEFLEDAAEDIAVIHDKNRVGHKRFWRPELGEAVIVTSKGSFWNTAMTLECCSG
jgi:hypothetical protein